MAEPGPGEVLIKVAAAGVNRPDMMQRKGHYPPPAGATDVPGLEVSGTVVSLGQNVSEPLINSEVCALVTCGGYAEYCLAAASICLPVPEKVLLVNDDKTIEVVNPRISGAVVEGLLFDNIKDNKILVFKKRRRQNSRKRYGHRQPLSKIQITKILSKGGKVVSEMKVNKIKLSNDPKLVKKKTVEKKTVVKTKKK